MKLRQAQASATYLLPDPGELDQRIVIRRRVDVPADDFGVTPTYPEQIRTWAKKAQPGAAAYQGAVQIENRVTHYFTIRFRRGITADHEVDANISWQTCTSTCDSAIRTWGDTVAECVIDKLCPSHTVVVFAYPEGKENAQN
ncbi:head-tail adaptor protein [Salmonella enterica]|nr:head-tail adaptor protein [Salmonella enterica]